MRGVLGVRGQGAGAGCRTTEVAPELSHHTFRFRGLL